MKDEDLSTMIKTKRDSSDSNGKGHYKFWVLAAIILLALWSMFTGSVTLKWSAGNLTRSSPDFDSTTLDDLDVLASKEILLQGRLRDGLYAFDHLLSAPTCTGSSQSTTTVPSQCVSSSFVNVASCNSHNNVFDLWHARLGHSAVKTVSQEVEAREKVVRRMWDVYTHSTTTRLPRFWSDAFQAAYEHLVSDVPGVRDAAVSEIAKMSLHSLPLQLQSHSHVQNIKGTRKMKHQESSMDTTIGSNQ